ncbi:MAG: hypothetical protein AAF556_05660 [Pseudomonadota bacterium]
MKPIALGLLTVAPAATATAPLVLATTLATTFAAALVLRFATTLTILAMGAPTTAIFGSGLIVHEQVNGVRGCEV